MTGQYSRRTLVSAILGSSAVALSAQDIDPPQDALALPVTSSPIIRTDGRPFRLRDQIITGSGDVGISARFPWRSSWHWPTANLSGVCVQGNWKKGIALEHAWNANLAYVTVQGPLVNAPFLNPVLDVGIDCGTSMDVDILVPRIVHAKTGILIQDPNQEGHGEGFYVTRGWIQHCLTDLKAIGLGSGGWPTPLLRVTQGHYAHLKVGVHIERYSDVQITGVNFYAEPYFNPTLALYLKGCRGVRIAGNYFWRNAPDVNGHAIVLDDCHDVTVSENRATNTLAAHLVVLDTCTHVEVRDNDFLPERVWNFSR